LNHLSEHTDLHQAASFVDWYQRGTVENHHSGQAVASGMDSAAILVVSSTIL